MGVGASSPVEKAEAPPEAGASTLQDPLLSDSEAPAEAQEEERPPGRRGARRLVQVAAPQKCTIVAGLLALLLRLPFSLASPFLVSEAIGAAIDGDLATARRYVLLLLAVGGVDAVLDFWNYYLFGVAQQRIVRDLRVGLLSAVLRQDRAFHDATPTGELTSRLTGDTAEMANDLTWLFRWATESVVRIGGILAVLFLTNWRLALVTVGVIPVCAVVNKVYGDWLHKNARAVQTALADAGTVAQEVLADAPTVHAFANEAGEVRRYGQAISRYYKLAVRQTYIQALYYMAVATFLVNTCVPVALLYYGTQLVVEGDMRSASLIAFMLYQGQLQEYTSNLMNAFTSLVKATGAGDKVFQLLDRRPRRRFPHPDDPGVVDAVDATNAGVLRYFAQARPTPCAGRVAFEHVHFTYPSRPGAPVLDDLSFEARPGEVVALVGASGSGKSTCLKMLQACYDPSRGRVLLDGIPAAQIEPVLLHKHCVSVVAQEPVLFRGTIEENIVYGLTAEGEMTSELLGRLTNVERAALRQRVIAAATVANAHDFVTALPLGYDSPVQERGLSLSGGQKQRIAIARAVILNPKVLLLDEATSALDAESEAVVQSALERAMRGRTVLLVAHRLSTVRRADKIVVLHNGSVVEMGTYHSLLQGEGKAAPYSFRALVNRQQETLPPVQNGEERLEMPE